MSQNSQRSVKLALGKVMNCPAAREMNGEASIGIPSCHEPPFPSNALFHKDVDHSKPQDRE
jgi:hypothetical protein